MGEKRQPDARWRHGVRGRRCPCAQCCRAHTARRLGGRQIIWTVSCFWLWIYFALRRPIKCWRLSAAGKDRPADRVPSSDGLPVAAPAPSRASETGTVRGRRRLWPSRSVVRRASWPSIESWKNHVLLVAGHWALLILGLNWQFLVYVQMFNGLEVCWINSLRCWWKRSVLGVDRRSVHTENCCLGCG